MADKAYKFRIYPTKEQAVQIQKTFGCCRFIYNHFLAIRTNAYEERGEVLHYMSCTYYLPSLRKELPWLCDVDSTALRASLKDLEAAYQMFFWGFRQMLTYKMAERGKKLITIDKWYPSSKTCRFCGAVNSELTLKDREWTCPSCGAHIDRDLNAAINIRNEGLANVS